MDAVAFRRLYDYHFAMNRQLWHHVSELSDEDFDRPSDYSQGSVRQQAWHLMTVDEVWFTQLRGDAWPDYLMPDAAQPVWTRAEIRERWDDVERRQREFGARGAAAAAYPSPPVPPNRTAGFGRVSTSSRKMSGRA